MWSWFICLTLVGATGGNVFNNRDYFDDVFFRHDSKIKEVTVERLSERDCDMQLRLRFTMSDKSNRVDGLAIACRHCRHDERLRFSFSVDGRRHRTTVSLMPTRWTVNEHKNQALSLLHVGRSFGICEGPSNQSCVISDVYCRDNETVAELGDNITCCRTYNASSFVWYYLHLRGINDLSEMHLDFDAKSSRRETPSEENQEQPLCDLSIQLFGIPMKFHSKEDLEQIRNRFNDDDVRIDIFRISENLTATSYKLSTETATVAPNNDDETLSCRSFVFPTNITVWSEDFLRVRAIATDSVNCTWPDLNDVGNCSSPQLELLIKSRNDTNISVCARFTQVERRPDRTVYSTALPLAAISQPNVTSSADTSGHIVMATVNMAACQGTEVRVVVEAYSSGYGSGGGKGTNGNGGGGKDDDSKSTTPTIPAVETLPSTVSSLSSSSTPLATPTRPISKDSPTTRLMSPVADTGATSRSTSMESSSSTMTTKLKKEQNTGRTSKTTSTVIVSSVRPIPITTTPDVMSTTDEDDLGNLTAYYLLEFHITREFTAALEDTNSDDYKFYNETLGPLLDEALRKEVPRRLMGWYRPLEFRNGSIVTTTGFTIINAISNTTKDDMKDSIKDTLLQANTSFLVDRNTIRIIRQFPGIDQSATTSAPSASLPDARVELLVGIGCGMAGLIFVVVIILIVVIVCHHKRRRKALTSRTPAVRKPAVDNWSIPRPQPRVWQTTSSMMSSERRRRGRYYYYDDDDNDEDLELNERSNGHAPQPLHRSANGGLTALFSSPAAAGRGTGSAPSAQDESGALPTPRLRRYTVGPNAVTGRHLASSGDAAWPWPGYSESPPTSEIHGVNGARRIQRHLPDVLDHYQTGAVAGRPVNGPPSVAAGVAQSRNSDSGVVGRRLDRLANDLDVDVAGYRQFDEESFSEVLTYYGSTGNIQNGGVLSRIQKSISKASNYLRPPKADIVHRTPPRYMRP